MKTKSLLSSLALSLGLMSSAGSYASADLENYIEDSWQYRALILQSKIDIGTPLVDASILFTHNSFNSSHYANAASYLDPNHIHSITEQLDLGVRMLELDSHWYSGAIRVCHGQSKHEGCSAADGLLEDRIAEVNSWMRRPEHADQVVFIYIQDVLDNHYAEASAILEKYFGEKIYAPGSCGQQIPRDLTKADILNSGKQVLVYGRGYDCAETTGTSWGQNVYTGFFETDITDLSPSPSCTSETFTPETIANNIVRIYEDSTTLSEWFGSPPKDIDAAYMKTMVDCGINIVGLDQLKYNDPRHLAAIWSWNQNEPNNAGSGEDCASHKDTGRINDAACDGARRFACVDTDGNWQASDASGIWSQGAAICSSENKGTFGMPKNGKQNLALTHAQSNINTLWVNYSDIAEEGNWQVGGAPIITLPAEDSRIVYRQLKNGKGKCLDLEGANSSSGTAVQQWGCHADPADMDNQMWYQDAQGRIHAKLNPELCIDASANSEGSNIYLYGCHDGANQKWLRGTNNSWRPASAPDMAMDISNGNNSASGDDSHLWTYHGGKTQMWYWFTPATYDKWIPDDAVTATQTINSSWSNSGGRNKSHTGNPMAELILTQATTVTLNLTSSSDTYLFLLDANGGDITTNDDGGEGYNSRITTQLSAGSYLIVAATYSTGKAADFELTTDQGTLAEFNYRRLKNNKGYCMDLEGEGTSAGTDVHQWGCQNDDYQKWYQDSMGRIHSKAARFMCIGIDGGGSSNGSDIIIWSCNSNTSQQWQWSTANSLRPGHATHKAFDISGGNNSYEGKDAHLWDYHGGKTQQWVWVD
jgi:hypothetical protein